MDRGAAADAATGGNSSEFVFFKPHDSEQVHAGRIVAKTTRADYLTIHEYRRKSTDKTQYVPLFKETATGKLQCRYEAYDYDEHLFSPPFMAVKHEISAKRVLMTGALQQFHINTKLQSYLQAEGIQ